MPDPVGDCNTAPIETIAGIVLLIVVIVTLAVVGYVFVWAARKDGEADQAVQRRLGIRRKTRLGR